MVFVVIFINRVRCNVDVVRAIIDDVVVPQDLALTVERRLVVVLADVVCLRQFIIVGRTVVAIVDDNVVLVAIDERRVGRHIARICLDRAIDRLDALASDREVSFVDFKVTLRVNDFVVDTCTILEADIFHIDGIRIRIFVGISRRTSSLVVSIETTGLDGKVIGTLLELIAIDNRPARHAFLVVGERCGERPVVDGRIAVGLLAAAIDVDLASEDFDGAAILCSGIFIAACVTFVRQLVVVRSSFDVVNRIVLRFTGRCCIAARTRCGLCPAFARERAAAIVVVSYVAFVEGIRIFVDVMLFIILSGKGCLSGGRDIVIRQFFAVDFRHVVSGDIDGRLYLEDVLVAVVLTCHIARRAPLCVRVAVEVRAELIGIWRVGIDLPVAVRIDGLLCRGQVLEGTICTACIDDNGITCRRLSNQCATALGIIRQSDCAIAIRICRDQTNLIAILDAMDRDIIRRCDGNKAFRCNLAIDSNIFICSRRGNLNLFVCGNLTNIHIALRGNLDVAICKVCSGIRMIIMDINGAKDFDIACRRLDGQVAQARAFAAAQASCIRHTFRAYGYIACTTIDGKCRVRQFCLTDKAVNRTCTVVDIVPAILIGPANSNIRLFR